MPPNVFVSGLFMFHHHHGIVPRLIVITSVFEPGFFIIETEIPGLAFSSALIRYVHQDNNPHNRHFRIPVHQIKDFLVNCYQEFFPFEWLLDTIGCDDIFTYDFLKQLMPGVQYLGPAPGA